MPSLCMVPAAFGVDDLSFKTVEDPKKSSELSLYQTALITNAIHDNPHGCGILAAPPSQQEEEHVRATSGFRALCAGLKVASSLHMRNVEIREEIKDEQARREWALLEMSRKLKPIVQVITRLGSGNRRTAQQSGRKRKQEPVTRWRRGTSTNCGSGFCSTSCLSRLLPGPPECAE